MTTSLYACAAQTGREYSVEQDLRDLGVWVWVPRTVYPVRPPNCRHFVATDKPRWPGYVFARMDAGMFFEARNVRYLHRTKMQLHPREAAQLLETHSRIEAENARARREIELGERKSAWEPGQRVEIIDGPFKDRLATFASIIDRTSERGYRLRLEIDGMPMPVDVNPLDVKAG